jgi:hypothetical protein
VDVAQKSRQAAILGGMAALNDGFPATRTRGADPSGTFDVSARRRSTAFPNESLQTATERADQAMYHAKACGRDQMALAPVRDSEAANQTAEPPQSKACARQSAVKRLHEHYSDHNISIAFATDGCSPKESLKQQPNSETERRIGP